jgi:hypothetical protein
MVSSISLLLHLFTCVTVTVAIRFVMMFVWLSLNLRFILVARHKLTPPFVAGEASLSA